MKTGFLKAWHLVLTIAASLLLPLLLALPKVVNLNRYRDSLQNLASEALGMQLQLGRLRWGLKLTSGIWLEADRLSLTGTLPMPASLECGKVVVRIAASPLLKKRLVIKDILLQGPVLTVESAGAAAPAIQPGSGSDDTHTAYTLELKSLRVEAGQVFYSDQSNDTRIPKLHLNDIAIKTSQLAPGSAVNFELALQQLSPEQETLAQLAACGSLHGLTPQFDFEQPRLTVDGELQALKPEALLPWLGAEWVARLEGSWRTTLRYQGWPGASGSISGEIDPGCLSYRDPSLWPEPLPGSGWTLQFSALEQADQFRFDSIAIGIGDIAAKAQLTLDSLGQSAVIRDAVLSAKIPLDSAGPLIPWLQLGEVQSPLRDLLAGGGTVFLTDIQLPAITLAEDDYSWEALFKALSGSIELSQLSARPAPTLPRFENINGHLSLADGALTSNDIRINIGALALPSITLKTSMLLDKPCLSLKTDGPVALATSQGEQVGDFLHDYGIAHLSTEGLLALTLDYDSAGSGAWRADGNATVNDLQLTALDTDNRLQLQGQMNLKLENTLQLGFEGVHGALNDAPVSIDGALTRTGGGSWSVDLDLVSSDFQPAWLGAFIPKLQSMDVAGGVDADLSIHYDGSKAGKTRLQGTLFGKKLGFQIGTYKIDELNTRLRLGGRRLATQETSFRLNQQPISVSGKLALDPRLSGAIALTSPTLNLDQLLDSIGNASTPPAVNADDSRPAPQLPEILRDATVAIEGVITKGVYRGLEFSELQLGFDYDQQLARDYELSAVVAGGTLKSNGELNFQDLSRIAFDTRFELSEAQLEDLAPAIVGHRTAVSGLLSSAGSLAGSGGSDLLSSLRGTIDIKAGPGRIAGVDPLTQTLFHVLEVINLEGLIEGTMGEDLAQQGIRFTSLSTKMDLDRGDIHILRSRLLTSAFKSSGQGLIHFASNTIDMEVELTVLGTFDAVVGLVPFVGMAASNMTRLYLLVRGPLERPRVTVQATKGVIETMKAGIKDPTREISRGLGSLLDIFDGKNGKSD